MLTELHHISNSLDHFGVTAAEVHPWVKPLSKGPFLIANLDKAGTLQNVEIPDESEAAAIPKIQKDNQNAFPSFKLAFPLFEIDAMAEIRRELKEMSLNDAARVALIDKAISTAPQASAEKNVSRFRRLLAFTAEVSGPLTAEPSGSPAVSRLINTILKPDFSAEVFLLRIGRAVLAAIEHGENPKIAQTVLIGDVNKKGQVDSGELPLVLDVVSDPDEYFIRVAHTKTGLFYSQRLLQPTQSEPDGFCSITGDHTTIERNILPSPRLPSLADTILFSANTDIPCLRRYDLIGSQTFPIGRQTAQKLNNTALWITSPDRKGKTWSMIPRSNGSGRDLLIAYVDLNPHLNAELAELLSDTDALEREGVFEAKAATLVEALDSLQGKLATGAVLHSFVLRRISKGQVQVDFTRQFPVERLVTALTAWRYAAANTPPFHLMAPAGKNKPAETVSPTVLFPGKVVEATKWIWIRGGHECQAASGISLSTVYDLFLGDASSSATAAKLLISHLLGQAFPLLLLTGDQLTRFGKTVRDMKNPARHAAVTAVSLLGVALYKLERTKELYMNETPFLIGRMLALADTLHSKYCVVVRRGDLPPQLLGNQHYQMATEHPQRALAVLAERLRVYQAWAKTASRDGNTQRDVGIAQRALSEMGSVASKLHGKLPDRLKDLDRAEMMLGYLAREKKTEDKSE